MRLLHLALASRERTIKRAGIPGSKWTITTPQGATAISRAVFAMPILSNFWTSHQWVRELRRSHDERMIAVSFRIDDHEIVHVGRYGHPHQLMQARASASWVTEHPAGAEVIVPHRIAASDILTIKEPTQRIGWTEVPETDKKWSCLCSSCMPAGSRDLMRRVGAAFAQAVTAAVQARSEEETVAALERLAIPLERARGRIAPTKLLVYARSPSPKVRCAAAKVLGHFKAAQVDEVLRGLLGDEHPDVQRHAALSLHCAVGAVRAAAYLQDSSDAAVVSFVRRLEWERDIGLAVKVLATFSHHATGAVTRAVTKTAKALLDIVDADAPEAAALRALLNRPRVERASRTTP